MLMNRVETALVNSPPRRWLQRWYEVPWMVRQGGFPDTGARVLEIGCGRGYGTQLILQRLPDARVDAIDLDDAMVRRARRRLAGHHERVRIVQGSATDLHSALDADDDSYDAVFDFAIIHHIPNWRAAIGEAARVLKPGGRFYFDEVTARALARPTYRLLFDHPTQDRFTAEEFFAELPRHGLTVFAALTRIHGDYLLGVARKQHPAP